MRAAWIEERGDAPAALVRLSRRGVPAYSGLRGSVAGLAGIAAQMISPQLVFRFLVDASGALVVLIYILIALAQIKLRSDRSPEQQRALPVQMWLYPYASYAAVAGMATVLLAMAFTPSMVREFWTSMATLALALLAAWLHGRRRATAVR